MFLLTYLREWAISYGKEYASGQMSEKFATFIANHNLVENLNEFY
jgi:hypothetical protein